MEFGLGFSIKPWRQFVINARCFRLGLPYQNNNLSLEELARSAPKTMKEFVQQKSLKPVIQPLNPRFLCVALIGAPNAGKSTLTNKLIGWRVCAVSKKVHTTRYNTKAVLTVDNTQIVFLDTPGLVTSESMIKHKLEPSLVTDPLESIKKADAVGVIVDASNKWTRDKLEPHLLSMLLKNQDKTFFLILNKCDSVKSDTTLLSVVRNLTGGVVNDEVIGEEKKIKVLSPSKEEVLQSLFAKTKKLHQREVFEIKPALKDGLSYSGFSNTFMVSAMNGNGVDSLIEYMKEIAKPQPWLYHPTTITDQKPQEIAIMALRGQLLNELKQEIPYRLQTTVELWEVTPSNVLHVVMNIYTPKNLIRIILGPKGEVIRKIVDGTRQELANSFRCDVKLNVIVKEKAKTS